MLLVRSFCGMLSAPATPGEHMPHIVAGIDVHKKMLAVVVADIAQEGIWSFQRRRFGATRRICAY